MRRCHRHLASKANTLRAWGNQRLVCHWYEYKSLRHRHKLHWATRTRGSSPHGNELRSLKAPRLAWRGWGRASVARQLDRASSLRAEYRRLRGVCRHSREARCGPQLPREKPSWRALEWAALRDLLRCWNPGPRRPAPATPFAGSLGFACHTDKIINTVKWREKSYFNYTI